MTTPECEPIDNGLTRDEQAVMSNLVAAFGAFARMPRHHPNELSDFTNGIHQCQNLLAVRIARREYPQGWPTYGNDVIAVEANSYTLALSDEDAAHTFPLEEIGFTLKTDEETERELDRMREERAVRAANRKPLVFGAGDAPLPPALTETVRRALEPFARAAEVFRYGGLSDGTSLGKNADLTFISIGDLRRAAAALTALGQARDGWRTMESAPRDGAPFFAGLWVHNNRSNTTTWEVFHVWVDPDTQDFDIECDPGWPIEEFEGWVPRQALPPDPPTPPPLAALTEAAPEKKETAE